MQNAPPDTATTETALAKIKQSDERKLRAGFASQIIAKHREASRYATRAKDSMGAAIHAAFDCGRLLSEQQQRLGRKGNWEAWCTEFLPKISRTTLWRYRSLYDQVSRYLEAKGENDVSRGTLLGLNFPSLRQLYIAFGILPEHESSDEPRPERSFIDPLLKVLGSSRFDALKDEQTLDRLSRDELFVLNRSLEPFLAIKSRIELRLSSIGTT